MRYWLMKTEPGEFSYADLARAGQTVWDGVRNHQAQNNLRAMAVGDRVLIYHSVGPKEVVGIAEVSRTFYPDPKALPGEKWGVVEVKPVRELSRPVTLAVIKKTPALMNIALVRQARLSVMPLAKGEFETILKLADD